MKKLHQPFKRIPRVNADVPSCIIQDNYAVKPHTLNNRAAVAAAAHDNNWNIVVKTQPPNSADFIFLIQDCSILARAFRARRSGHLIWTH